MINGESGRGEEEEWLIRFRKKKKKHMRIAVCSNTS